MLILAHYRDAEGVVIKEAELDKPQDCLLEIPVEAVEIDMRVLLNLDPRIIQRKRRP